MTGKLEVSVDKLPIKRPDLIEENGLERFLPSPSFRPSAFSLSLFFVLLIFEAEALILAFSHSDVGYEEKRESLIRRIDFSWEVEKDEEKKKKKKKKKKRSRESSAEQWELQSMVENLHLPHQESSPSLSISSTLWKLMMRAVTVVSMTRPRPFPILMKLSLILLYVSARH
ncbi:mediator of RNA polymerase II transcription subunit 17-like [Rosa chinensis]|uniref:mediator of RNA polymerase II transcription subunit 17-like n=1 Tax=Rosa chinensis TaxID=74649 RepID=UPI000D090ED7|nr:mediator of RNA polymerase II transcription subunit 17-like [Rosa chinensis]XP_040369300.1 mediator of RNA polymerase II transcription subunit 17-like [Rosa chinensis]